MATQTRMLPEEFEFEKTLGSGAFSKVLIAKYTPDGKRYAVKIISKKQILQAATQEERVKMAEVAKRESRMLLICNHPSIIRFHAAMQTTDDLMYVTELCDGGELLDAIKRRGALPHLAAVHLAAELLSAIEYLHTAEKPVHPIVAGAPLRKQCILHRDIKPENIMLTAKKHLKLIDFGTAVICESEDEHAKDERQAGNKGGGGGGAGNARPRAATFCGTTHYMSPELLNENYTCTASDWWAFGCVIFHMLAGVRPFEASTPYLLINKILTEEPNYPPTMDPNAKDLIQQLLQKDPSKRPGPNSAGGAEVLKKHPFFAHVKSWDDLTTADVSSYWIRDAEWQKDDAALGCKLCGQPFTLFRRKHHCRACGLIYCDKCSSRTSLIPESNYTGQERVCDTCYVKLKGTEYG
jgi:serine/threonine protein kinase